MPRIRIVSYQRYAHADLAPSCFAVLCPTVANPRLLADRKDDVAGEIVILSELFGLKLIIWGWNKLGKLTFSFLSRQFPTFDGQRQHIQAGKAGNSVSVAHKRRLLCVRYDVIENPAAACCL
jgi:hypothetical protein